MCHGRRTALRISFSDLFGACPFHRSLVEAGNRSLFKGISGRIAAVWRQKREPEKSRQLRNSGESKVPLRNLLRKTRADEVISTHKRTEGGVGRGGWFPLAAVRGLICGLSFYSQIRGTGPRNPARSGNEWTNMVSATFTWNLFCYT